MNINDDWKQEFITLYMSNTADDYKKSLDLKRQNMPVTLYRYRSIKTGIEFARLVKSLRGGHLYCACRDELNDPFELRSPLSSKTASNYFGNKKDDKSVYFESLKKHFDETEISEVMQAENWFERLQQLIFREQAEKSGLTMSYIENTLNAILMNQVEDLSTAYESIFNMNRIASFTEDYKNLPMWQHYSNAHYGVCLAYDMSKLHISDVNHLYPVIYVKELPDVVNFSFKRLNADKKPPFGIVNYHCIHKLIDWNYEKEWRYIFEPGSRYFSYTDIPADYWNKGIEINFVIPSKIILGNNVEQDVKTELRKVANENRITITQMKITPYGLDEVHVL